MISGLNCSFLVKFQGFGHTQNPQIQTVGTKFMQICDRFIRKKRYFVTFRPLLQRNFILMFNYLLPKVKRTPPRWFYVVNSRSVKDLNFT